MAVNGTELLVGPGASVEFAVPSGNAGLAGVTATDATPYTFNAKGVDGMPVMFAVMFVAPPAALRTPVAMPLLLLMVAIKGLLEAKFTLPAAGTPVVPSV